MVLLVLQNMFSFKHRMLDILAQACWVSDLQIFPPTRPSRLLNLGVCTGSGGASGSAQVVLAASLKGGLQRDWCPLPASGCVSVQLRLSTLSHRKMRSDRE